MLHLLSDLLFKLRSHLLDCALLTTDLWLKVHYNRVSNLLYSRLVTIPSHWLVKSRIVVERYLPLLNQLCTPPDLCLMLRIYYIYCMRLCTLFTQRTFKLIRRDSLRRFIRDINNPVGLLMPSLAVQSLLQRSNRLVSLVASLLPRNFSLAARFRRRQIDLRVLCG